MYCPKCGTNNPDDGKFCRKCGCDLKLVSDVISGKLTVRDSDKPGKSKKEPNWESALVFLSISLAMFISAIVLAFQPMGTGWWFWLLFSAFPMLGLGVGQIIRLRQIEAARITNGSGETAALSGPEAANALPPGQTEFVPDIIETRREPGDRVPASVVEGTTRHLEMDRAAETTALPKTDE